MIGILLLASAPLLAATAAVPPGFSERFADVNGTRLRYLIGGKGNPVVLLHGYAQTGHMWGPILPPLAERHTVIVPDLHFARTRNQGVVVQISGVGPTGTRYVERAAPAAPAR
jgi:hypothetical protein